METLSPILQSIWDSSSKLQINQFKSEPFNPNIEIKVCDYLFQETLKEIATSKYPITVEQSSNQLKMVVNGFWFIVNNLGTETSTDTFHEILINNIKTKTK